MEHHEWGWMVVVYLYVGGLGAGSLFLSGLAHLSRRAHLFPIARAGALAAPVLVGAGSGLLVFDLGRPLHFWRLFTGFQPVSPMWVGSWLLMAFSAVGMVYAALYLPSKWAETFGRWLPPLRGVFGALARWNRVAEDHAGDTFPDSPKAIRKLRNGMAIIGIPLGIGVGIYTGVLLGAIPARPLWNTPMLAQLFLFSALSTATALLFLLAPRFSAANRTHSQDAHRALLSADLVFIAVELFLIIPFVILAQLRTLSVREALSAILGGHYTGIFWIGVVVCGILFPMLLEVGDLMGWLKRLPKPILRTVHGLVPILILVGGYLLRWVFVHAGQDSHFL